MWLGVVIVFYALQAFEVVDDGVHRPQGAAKARAAACGVPGSVQTGVDESEQGKGFGQGEKPSRCVAVSIVHCEKLTLPPTGSLRFPDTLVIVPDQEIDPQVTCTEPDDE